MHAIYSDTHNTYQSESKHSEMDPVRQNLIQRTVRSVHVCVHCTVHNCCTQYYTERKPDNFPSYTRTVTVGHEITAESESLRFVTFVVTFSYLRQNRQTDGVIFDDVMKTLNLLANWPSFIATRTLSADVEACTRCTQSIASIFLFEGYINVLKIMAYELGLIIFGAIHLLHNAQILLIDTFLSPRPRKVYITSLKSNRVLLCNVTLIAPFSYACRENKLLLPLIKWYSLLL